MLIFASKKEILMNENDIQPLRTVYLTFPGKG